MLCGVWESAVDFGTSTVAARGYDFYIGQVEGPNQYDRLVANLDGFRQEHPTMPAAVVTNVGGMTVSNADGSLNVALSIERCQPFRDYGFACIAEGHIKEDGVDPRTRVVYCEQNLGFTGVQPMAGLGNGATLSDYPGLETAFGWSVFAAEELL